MQTPYLNLMNICNKVFAIVMVLTLIIGCASIIKGELQTVSFKSNPSDAKLIVYNERDGGEIINVTTPHTATLKRGYGYFKKSKYKVVIEKDGFERQEIALEGSPNGWYLGGNLIFGGLIGYLIVDPATGAMWTLEPEDINVDLKKKELVFQQNDGLTVVLRNEFPELSESVQNRMKPVKAP